MNERLVFLIRTVCLLALLMPGRAQDFSLGINVEFDLLVVRMPESLALPLIPELRDKKRAVTATERVMKLIAEKRATLIGWPVISTWSGRRADVEQIDEFRYATEYDPPVKTTTVETPLPANPTPPTVPDERKPEPPQKTTTTVSVSEGVPTNFETRNVGVTFEIEPVIDKDLKTIDLNLVLQHIRLLTMRKVEIEQKGTGKKVVVEQPEFLTNKVTTSLTVQSGDRTLLGVFKVNDPPEQIELFILHTEVKTIK